MVLITLFKANGCYNCMQVDLTDMAQAQDNGYRQIQLVKQKTADNIRSTNDSMVRLVKGDAILKKKIVRWVANAFNEQIGQVINQNYRTYLKINLNNRVKEE